MEIDMSIYSKTPDKRPLSDLTLRPIFVGIRDGQEFHCILMYG